MRRAGRAWVPEQFGDVPTLAGWLPAQVADAVAAGSVDGAFIDGNRGGWMSSITGACTDDERRDWAAALNDTVARLATTLGPDKTLITNYATPEALHWCQGGMLERGGGPTDVFAFADVSCGPDGADCLLDYHAQYADRSDANFNKSLAQFLIGASQNSYFGVGDGWSGDGPDACATWLRRYPEYAKPLGEPVSDYAVAAGSHGACTLLDPDPSTSDTSGCLFSRDFESASVFLGQYAPPSSARDQWGDAANYGSCVWWADGSLTGDADDCPPNGRVF